MRVPSTSASAARRQPQQARASIRRAKFLDVAALLFGKLGYEAVTMTAIAEQAQASIGTLYDYFPDKQTIALALMTKYTAEADLHWKAILDVPVAPEKDVLADLFVDGVLAFVRERPAYLPLLGTRSAAQPRGQVRYARSEAARRPLRKTIANTLQALSPQTTDERAFLRAQVIVEIIKGLLAVYKETGPKERQAVTEEFKKLIRAYLMESLG